MHRTISGDPADLKVKVKEKTCLSAAPTNLCQGKNTMFLQITSMSIIDNPGIDNRQSPLHVHCER